MLHHAVGPRFTSKVKLPRRAWVVGAVPPVPPPGARWATLWAQRLEGHLRGKPVAGQGAAKQATGHWPHPLLVRKCRLAAKEGVLSCTSAPFRLEDPCPAHIHPPSHPHPLTLPMGPAACGTWHVGRRSPAWSQRAEGSRLLQAEQKGLCQDRMACGERKSMIYTMHPSGAALF